jgi:hypothetical protein
MCRCDTYAKLNLTTQVSVTYLYQGYWCHTVKTVGLLTEVGRESSQLGKEVNNMDVGTDFNFSRCRRRCRRRYEGRRQRRCVRRCRRRERRD